MGIWGTGPFENDDAMNWVADLVETEDLSALEEAFDEIIEGAEDITLLDAHVALAAVAILAEFIDPQDASVPPEVLEWLREIEEDIDPEFLELAIEALDAIATSESPLAQEHEDDEDWDDMIEALKVRVQE